MPFRCARLFLKPLAMQFPDCPALPKGKWFTILSLLIPEALLIEAFAIGRWVS